MTQYRVRKGFFGKSVLQELLPAVRRICGPDLPPIWADVKYSQAPRAFVKISIPEIIDLEHK